jgi:hypothetical protein
MDDCNFDILHYFTGSWVEMDTGSAYSRRHHETINKRFKQWGVLKQVYRGEISLNIVKL